MLDQIEEWCATDADIAAHPEWAESGQLDVSVNGNERRSALACPTLDRYPDLIMAPPPRSSKPNKPDTTQPFKTAIGAAVRAIGGQARPRSVVFG